MPIVWAFRTLKRGENVSDNPNEYYTPALPQIDLPNEKTFSSFLFIQSGDRQETWDAKKIGDTMANLVIEKRMRNMLIFGEDKLNLYLIDLFKSFEDWGCNLYAVKVVYDKDWFYSKVTDMVDHVLPVKTFTETDISESYSEEQAVKDFMLRASSAALCHMPAAQYVKSSLFQYSFANEGFSVFNVYADLKTKTGLDLEKCIKNLISTGAISESDVDTELNYAVDMIAEQFFKAGKAQFKAFREMLICTALGSYFEGLQKGVQISEIKYTANEI